MAGAASVLEQRVRANVSLIVAFDKRQLVERVGRQLIF
jgi:hypothetical protein